MKVCYFGTYRANYSRNQIMIAGLRAAGVEVIECHVPLWRSIEDRVQVAGGQWASVGFFRRVVTTYRRLLATYAQIGQDYEVMVLGYPGQLDVFLARLLTWWRGKPLALDLFMSIYLIAAERKIDAKSGFSVRLLRRLEWLACRLPNRLICDTSAYVAWHGQTHGLAPEKFRLVPTGADDRLFQPVTVNKATGEPFTVLYYGTYIPNHGVETIIEAARLLQDQPDIHFELVGDGPSKAAALALAGRYGLENVSFIDWIEREALPRKIATADLLLGAFGETPQSLMTIQNKIYESLAMGKPIITGTAPIISQTLPHLSSTYLIDRNSPPALAEGILWLYNNPETRTALGQRGLAVFQEKFSIQKLGEQFKQHLAELARPI